MARWLVRFGYDGAGFSGWARQPRLRTVEGVLREGILRTGVAASLETAGLAVASRTDRGVSARRNALTVTSGLPTTALLRTLNGIAPDIYFTASTEVPPDFSARAAEWRWYRYFEPLEGHRLERWSAAAGLFQGEVDVRSFGRDQPLDRPVRRSIDSIRVRQSGRRWLVVDVTAPSFVWGMVRKIIAALRKVDDGSLDLATLEAALRGEDRLTLPLAEPEGLVLWEVHYPLRWARGWSGPNRAQARYLAGVVRRSRLRERIAVALPGGYRSTRGSRRS
jgi:tRNA pseudouridine38-40 synthase